MAIDYSQYAGMAMPDVMKKARFMFGGPPQGWDWGAYQAATGVDPMGVTAGGAKFDAAANNSLWGSVMGHPAGGATAAPPGNPMLRPGGGPVTKSEPAVGGPTPATPPPYNPLGVQSPATTTAPPTTYNPLAVRPPATTAAPPPTTYNPLAATPPPGATATPPPPGAPPNTPTPPPFNPNDPNTFGNISQFLLNPQLQGAFSYMLQQALARYNDPNGQQYYSGQITPGLTSDGSAAQALLRQFAAGMGGTNAATQSFYNSIMGLGTGPNAGQSPQLDAAVQAMRTSANQQFTNPGGPLSQIRTAAGAAGQQGGTREGIAEGVAAGQEATGLDNSEAQMRYQSLQDSYANAMRAMGLLPQMTAAGMAPGLALSGVDAQNRDIQLGQNTDSFNRWAYNSTIPDIRLSNLMSLINGSLPLGGTSYNQSVYPGWYTAMMQAQGSQGSSTAGNVLGAGAGLAGIWQLLFGGGH